MTDKTEELIDEIYNQYSWNLQGKGKPHDVVSHNIDLSLAIREAIKQTKAECKEKFKEWINGLEQVHYCPKCKSFYCYSEEHKKIIYVNYEELQKADEEEKA